MKQLSFSINNLFLFAVTGFLLSTCGQTKQGTKGSALSRPHPDSPVLLEVGDTKISRATFKRAYEKNNKDKSNAYTKSSLENYLDLYINYRLKVKEAKEIGLDTLPSIQKELKKYRDQLASSYLTDSKILDKLVQEAYERSQKEVQTSHILIKVSPNASPEDTQKTYQKALNIKKKLEEGADFAKMARKHSDDPSVNHNGGDLGYMTALQLVYPYENAAYNTPVGEITGPVRTRFGYHIIKVTDKRPAQGKILTAHIFISKPRKANSKQLKTLEKKVNHIYQKVQKGTDFSKVARQHSDDPRTAKKGGKFRWFNAGENLLPAYVNSAFSLKKNGAIAEPVETRKGWYIIKRLDKKPPPDFDKIKDQLRKQIKKDKRSQIAKQALVKEIKNDYNFQEYPEAKQALLKKVDRSILNGRWKAQKAKGMNDAIFQLRDKKYTQYDLARFIDQHPRMRRGGTKKAAFEHYYQQFVQQKCVQYEKAHLEEKYPEFRALINEYFNGILLFEITDRKVWTKAVKDTSGLRKYFNNHRSQYTYEKRVKATVYKCQDKETAEQVRKLLAQRSIKSSEELLNMVNKGDNKKLSIDEGTFEKGDNQYIDKVSWEKGLSDNLSTLRDRIVIVEIHEVLSPRMKKLNEAKGKVIADYQNHLKRQWLNSLKKKYPVKVHDDVLKSLVKP